jgi:phage gpG-like protein
VIDGVTDTASDLLNAMADRVGDLTPVMVMIGRHQEKSVRQNFNVGGRPSWIPLQVDVGPKGSRSKKFRRVQGRTREGGPLVLSGDLRGSVGFTAERADVAIWEHPHSDPIKAFVHMYGTDSAGVNHNVHIPIRDSLSFQPEDVQWALDAIRGWIRVGSAGVET